MTGVQDTQKGAGYIRVKYIIPQHRWSPCIGTVCVPERQDVSRGLKTNKKQTNHVIEGQRHSVLARNRRWLVFQADPCRLKSRSQKPDYTHPTANKNIVKRESPPPKPLRLPVAAWLSGDSPQITPLSPPTSFSS